MIIITLMEYYLKPNIVTTVSQLFNSWAIIIAAIALGLGLANVVIRWTSNAMQRRQEWYFQIWGLFIISFMIITGLSTTVFGQHPWHVWMYSNVQQPLDATIYSLLGFFIASAVYRAFKAKNVESAAFLIAGVLCVLRNAPVAQFYFPPLTPIGDWLIGVLQMGARRGVLITVALGTLAFTVRTLLGREKSSSL
jgi:hypothetical protein